MATFIQFHLPGLDAAEVFISRASDGPQLYLLTYLPNLPNQY